MTPAGVDQNGMGEKCLELGQARLVPPDPRIEDLDL